MKKLIDILAAQTQEAFEKAGYDKKYGAVKVSDRPDLCEFQCNGAMPAAKEYKKAPRQIAEEVKTILSEEMMIKDVEVAGPGFLNFKVKSEALAEYLNRMKADARLGVDLEESPVTVVIDYGGPNVAKPLHIGHLRAAIIGESIKRTIRFMGNEAIGDVHLGDWGLQMGLIITELQERKPELVYFDTSYDGEYPAEPPFTISELEEIYPTASGKSKTDAEFKEKALQATHELQEGRRGYRALWNHIMQVSVTDLKKNYEKLNVSFDIWKKESDAQPYIPDMVKRMKEQGIAYEDDGALIVDVSEPTDTKEIPPCIILKSDGASLYTTTDLATIVERKKLFDPKKLIYVVDKRQAMHFLQVFRCAKKAGLIGEEAELKHLGFGTMNGKDGKPFKTRDGGVMRLENLIREIKEEMLKKITENKGHSNENDEETARIVGLAALKYGDLSNQATKDYIFDMDRFTSFEGNTGPYILYTMVRIKSILEKYKAQAGSLEGLLIEQAFSEDEKDLMLKTAAFSAALEDAYKEYAPHKLCAYIYELANSLNHFYHENRILAETDEKVKKSRIALLELVLKVFEQSIDLLGFEAPEKM